MRPSVSTVGGMGPLKTAMNNPYLNQRSEVFTDDSFENVEKRCFLLLCGKQANDPAFSLDFGVNAFDDPKVKKNL